jgi:hypothetical protein
VFTDEPLPIPFAGVDLVFLDAGLSRYRPQQHHKHERFDRGSGYQQREGTPEERNHHGKQRHRGEGLTENYSQHPLDSTLNPPDVRSKQT